MNIPRELERIRNETNAKIAADNQRHEARKAIITKMGEAAQRLDLNELQRLRAQLDALN